MWAIRVGAAIRVALTIDILFIKPYALPNAMAKKTTDIRVRYAPSPTGSLHIGGLRTALYNELFARRHGGTFILRIEDTDRERLVEGAAQGLIQSLERCGVVADEGMVIKPNGSLGEQGDAGPYLQSLRKDLHRAYANKLVGAGKAYPCFCTELELKKMRNEQQASGLPTRYDRRCRDLSTERAQKRIEAGDEHVIRLKIPLKGTLTFTDIIRGEISFDWKQIDDQVIIKSDGMPTYHLAATCDDHDMRISHVIRGDEWLASTPKHLFIYESLDWTPPQFAHVPLLLNTDRSKLSKRQGDVAVEDYLAKGYLPEALINFVAMLGWNPTSDREIYTHEELRQLFDLTKVNSSGAVVNMEKMDWMNHQYMRALKEEDYLQLAGERLRHLTDDHVLSDRVALLVRERVSKLADLAELAEPYLKTVSEIDLAILPWKTQPTKDVQEKLQTLTHTLEQTDVATWESPMLLEAFVKNLIASKQWGNGEALWPLRVALSGQKQSPGPFELLWALGRDRALERLRKTLSLL